MACGCPVVTSRETSLAEIAGSAALLIKPQENQLAPALQNLWTSQALRTRLSKLGLNQAKKFTWDKTAAQTVKVYETLVR
ncbi:TPA: hypothetical protein DEB02_01960, partial [Candidatus Beckwithbacteria bacterium]|nr:hypothetical protein [Candidatus Beckwithbacteria bacterium]